MSMTGTTEKILYLDTSLPFAERAKDLVGRLTLEEKVGLMNHPAHGIPRIGIVFICQVEDAEVKPNAKEVREAFWVKLEALREIVEGQPERIFTLQLPVLNYYLKRRGD